MDKVAIIGASYLQLPLIAKAKEMGYETHVFAWEANDVGEKEADFFHPISIVEKEKILEVCKEIGISGICSIASDLAVLTVNYVANHMGLPGNSLESSYLSSGQNISGQCLPLTSKTCSLRSRCRGKEARLRLLRRCQGRLRPFPYPRP